MEARWYAALGVIACLASANCHNARSTPERPEPVTPPKLPDYISTTPACGGTGTVWRYDYEAERDRQRAPLHAKTQAALDAAVRVRDAYGVLRLLREPVLNRGIWFPDAACDKRFGTPGRIAGNDLEALARCLVQLELQATPREISLDNELPAGYGHALFSYQPGIEIEVELDGEHIRGLGYLYESEQDRGRPTLTVEAFEALRTGGTPDLSDGHPGWVKVCLDKAGTVDRFVALVPPYYASDAPRDPPVGTWAFRPFEQLGRATPACAVLAPSGAAWSGAKRMLPNPELAMPPVPSMKPVPPRTREVSQSVIEDLRIAGTTHIRPDAVTRHEMTRTGKDVFRTSHKVCLDATGAVATVSPLAPSRFAAYDSRIMRQMMRWRFLPYRVRGKPVPVCSTVEIEFRIR